MFSNGLQLVKTLAFCAAVAMPGAISKTYAQGSSEPENSYTVMLNQDNFFGFYPSFNGLLNIKENLDFSFYGIVWTKPAFGLNSGNTGDDLWTEFGAGVNMTLLDGRMTFKPQLGFTNGALLSGGNLNEFGEVTGSNALDGIVPSLTVNYSDDRWEAEWYSGYYAALRKRNSDAALDFLHVWANAGGKFSPYVSAGLHWEYLDNTRNTYPGGSTASVYQWVGPYVQFSLPKGFFARFTAGADIRSGASGDFYKLNVGMSF
jgi:hypothetical protein